MLTYSIRIHKMKKIKTNSNRLYTICLKPSEKCLSDLGFTSFRVAKNL